MEMIKKIAEIIKQEELKDVINNARDVDFDITTVNITGDFRPYTITKLINKKWDFEVNRRNGYVEGRKVF